MPRSRALTRSLAAAASLFLVANSVAIVHVAARDPVTEQPEILRATTDGAHLYDVGLRSRGHGNVTDAHRSIPGNDTGDVVEPAVKMENPTSIHA
ncbi:MAG TPA: hypothetical protein VGQ64_11285, partial [Candidatus Limnocylindrales bacterium]|nr:hypothetical protein [Candidatus Limnocylindrales bacterium]